MRDVTKAVLRANPGYELVLGDRLGGSERDLLGGGEQLYGVLRPRPDTGLELRGASPDTALLFLTLREPAALPAYARAALAGDALGTVARLVLDGVLEIEHAGGFASGAAATQIVTPGSSAAGSGRIGELSRAALAYGQELADRAMTERQLAVRLYTYGGRPVTATLSRRLEDAGAIDALLGLDRGGSARAAVDCDWLAVPGAKGEPVHWRSWRARGRRAGGGTGYKLYVSPAGDGIRIAFAAVAGLLSGARGAAAFKVGAGVAGLCRPDKLVVYFDRLDDLHEGAARLRDELAGAPAQGVPFTAAVTVDGLLSWGRDPSELAGVSWRQWVCERLAEYLVAGEAPAAQRSQFALGRLRLAGVDTDTWIPTSGMWGQALARA